MNNQDQPSTSIELKIPFFDVDTMQVAWHGHYLKYFEIARCALLDEIDFGYTEMAACGYIWPVVDIRVKYIKPCHFNQAIVVTATLNEYENRIKIDYLIHDKITQEKLTSGHSIQVAIDQSNSELCYTSPDVLLKKIQDYREC